MRKANLIMRGGILTEGPFRLMPRGAEVGDKVLVVLKSGYKGERPAYLIYSPKINGHRGAGKLSDYMRRKINKIDKGPHYWWVFTGDFALTDD